MRAQKVKSFLNYISIAGDTLPVDGTGTYGRYRYHVSFNVTFGKGVQVPYLPRPSPLSHSWLDGPVPELETPAALSD